MKSRTCSGWIKHDGGDCPVGANVAVQMILRGGIKMSGISTHQTWNYEDMAGPTSPLPLSFEESLKMDLQIVQYRIIMRMSTVK